MPSPYGRQRPPRMVAPSSALDELAGEAALPDARLAVDGDEVGAAVADGPVEGVRRAARARPTRPISGATIAEQQRLRAVGRADHAPGVDRLGAAPDLDLAHVLRLDRAGGEAARAGADQDLARAGSLLEAGGEVDRLAGRERRLGRVDDDLARPRCRRGPRARARRPPGGCPSPARIARSASSSCAWATPNAARTASPANFSTIPPCVVTQCVTSSKNRVTRRRTISGSAALISSVEPTRSTNRHGCELSLHT